MKQDKAVYTFGACGVGVILGLMAACAGGDTPARTPELVDQIAVMYAGAEPVGAAAAGGGSGVGGSGSGGSSTGSGGGTMAGGAGSGSLAGGTGGGTGNSCDGFAILQTNCQGSSCHSASSSGPGDLSNFVADEKTAEAFAGEQSDNCAKSDNAAIFDPANPAASLVVKKITGTASCGSRMPLGATMQALSDDELTCVKTWIGTLSP